MKKAKVKSKKENEKKIFKLLLIIIIGTIVKKMYNIKYIGKTYTHEIIVLIQQKNWL